MRQPDTQSWKTARSCSKRDALAGNVHRSLICEEKPNLEKSQFYCFFNVSKGKNVEKRKKSLKKNKLLCFFNSHMTIFTINHMGVVLLTLERRRRKRFLAFLSVISLFLKNLTCFSES